MFKSFAVNNTLREEEKKAEEMKIEKLRANIITKPIHNTYLTPFPFPLYLYNVFMNFSSLVLFIKFQSLCLVYY